MHQSLRGRAAEQEEAQCVEEEVAVAVGVEAHPEAEAASVIEGDEVVVAEGQAEVASAPAAALVVEIRILRGLEVASVGADRNTSARRTAFQESYRWLYQLYPKAWISRPIF